MTTLQLVPLEDISAMLSKGWRIVARYRWWAVLMERTET